MVFSSESTCLPVCVFKRLKAQLSDDNIHALLLALIKNPSFIDEEIESIWQDNLERITTNYLYSLLTKCIKFNRYCLFVKLRDHFCEVIKAYSNEWYEIGSELSWLFSYLDDLERFELNALQVEMLDLLIEGLGEVALAATVKFKSVFDHIESDSLIRER